jgi:hypothetical protein
MPLGQEFEDIMKDLPATDQTFRSIITKNRLYADKTEYIYRMITSFESCFLSRPRRFGKTTLLNVLEELFLGNRELFKGLWIDSSDYEFKKHPVIKFRLDYEKLNSSEELKNAILIDLKNCARRNGLDSDELFYDKTIGPLTFTQSLGRLLEELNIKNGVEAVVLVDEYDAPITKYIRNLKLAEENRVVLHDFFAALKANLEYLRFTMVTGITRFALTSMESGPNHLKDLSLNPQFAGICGFTVSEFDRLFEDRMEDTLNALKANGWMKPDDQTKDLRQKILHWYDGYNWLGSERILNPYSILNFFSDQVFDAFWFQSGPPSHLTALVQEKPLDFVQPKLEGYLSEDFRKLELGQLEAVPVLFHSGYLTVDRNTVVTEEFDGNEKQYEIFSFKLPNEEVRLSYNSYCLKSIFGNYRDELKNIGPDFQEALMARNAPYIETAIGNLLANITHRQHFAQERYYHSLIQAAILTMGMEVLGEISGSIGQSDMGVFLPGKKRAVIEIKYAQANDKPSEEDKKIALAKAVNDALEAIRTKDYAGPFKAYASEIIGLGIGIYGRSYVKAAFAEESAPKTS